VTNWLVALFFVSVIIICGAILQACLNSMSEFINFFLKIAGKRWLICGGHQSPTPLMLSFIQPV
jgi:hypothetical protein